MNKQLDASPSNLMYENQEMPMIEEMDDEVDELMS